MIILMLLSLWPVVSILTFLQAQFCVQTCITFYAAFLGDM